MDDLWLVFGLHAVEEMLRVGKRQPESIWLEQGVSHNPRLQEIEGLAIRKRCMIRKVERRVLDRMAEGGVHQGVIARVPPRQQPSLDAVLDRLTQVTHPLLLLLDGVEDPRNLGAILRCADGAGVQAVITPKDRSAPLSVAAIKTSSGAAEHIDVVRVTNLARTIQTLQGLGYFVVGLDGDADMSIYQAKLSGPIALVAGGEGRGLRRLTKERCDTIVSIPMLGHVQSLNVAVAVGVVLYEVYRQRQ